MLSRISVVFRLLTITAVSLLALAGVGVIGVLSTGTIQEMVSRTETEALKPIEQISELNERLQESFREILLALQHNPTLPAVKYHNHVVKVHIDAVEKALQRMTEIFQEYRKSPAGDLFKEITARAEAAESARRRDSDRSVWPSARGRRTRLPRWPARGVTAGSGPAPRPRSSPAT